MRTRRETKDWVRDNVPHIARHGSSKERWKFVLLGLGTVYEGLVMVLSLGYLNVSTRAWLLFDVFVDD
jgi:hypothetical protein